MNIPLKENERLDDLQNGYHIIQNTRDFCYGIDAVLLSDFARVKKGEQALDLGTGTGIIPILLKAKTQGEHFTGLEIQEQSAEMAGRSVAYNHLEDAITIRTGDIKEAAAIFGRASFSVVTCNPPYMHGNHGLTNPHLPKAIARHEVLCTLEDVISQTAQVLKSRGRFYGTPPVSTGGDHGTDDEIQTGAEADASGISVCGPGAEHGSDRRASGRKFKNYSGKTADRI